MDALMLARWQFAITTVYHFFFVPLTLGLSIYVAIIETMYVRTGDEKYKRMVKFWGKLFLINFAMGVATGVVQEFQFGMNWSEYSRFVGDIFGAPLAIEALLAFFLESTFLGIWIFGWDKLSPKMHATAIWLVAIGSNLSALWILIANSFMQHPVGYVLRNGRAEMTDFGALVFNSNVFTQFPHVVTGGMITAAFFVLGISAYHLMRKSSDRDLYVKSMKVAGIYGFIAALLVMGIGHVQMQQMVHTQPMKMAAAEAVMTSENPAGLSLFSVVNEKTLEDVWSIRIPGLLSFLTYNSPHGEIKGVRELQAEYEAKYGPGHYIPPVTLSYWAFRIMVLAGLIMFVAVLLVLPGLIRGKETFKPFALKLLFWSIFLPFIANSAGWIFTEIGRQPWIVFGVMKVEDGLSVAASSGEVLASLVLFTLTYAVLMVVDIFLLRKFAVAGVSSRTAG